MEYNQTSLNIPKISVIIPNYNHAKFLGKRLETALSQSYKNIEIICLDDDSTDNSLEIFNSYKDRGNFTMIKSNKNSGSPFIQWNKGVAIARGEYVWIAESDDLAHFKFLDTLANRLDTNPKVGLAYCQSYFIDENDHVTGLHLKHLQKQHKYLWNNDFVFNGKEMLASHMAMINVIPNASAVLFRKAVYEKAGGADNDLRLCGDWLIWSKMLLISDLAFVSRPLNYFRTHNSTVRSQIHRKFRYMTEYLEVLKFIHRNIEVSKRAKQRAAYHLKIRWLRLALYEPREISIDGIRHIFQNSFRIFGFFEAIQFLLIGCISLVPFIHSTPFTVRTGNPK